MPTWPVRFDLRVDFDDPQLLRLLIESEALARAVNGIPVPPHVRARLNSLNIARAIRGTTGIEGSRLTQEEVSRILESEPEVRVLPANREREEKEARNAATVMLYVSEVLDAHPDQPVTEDLICTLHDLTTRGIPYAANVPGHYRSHAANAGDYVPPRRSEDVRRLMTEFVGWLNSPPATSWHPVIRAVAAHFYFISIHPFGDGNGRTARAIESYLLYQAKLNALGFYSLANFYYRNRGRYIELLDHTRFESGGDLTPFVKFSTDGLLAEIRTVYDEVIREATVIAFRDYAREVLQSNGKLGTPSGDRMLLLVFGLAHESVDVGALRGGAHPLHALYKERSLKTLSRDLDFLVRHELIARMGTNIQARLDVMDRYRGP